MQCPREGLHASPAQTTVCEAEGLGGSPSERGTVPEHAGAEYKLSISTMHGIRVDLFGIAIVSICPRYNIILRIIY